MTVSSTTTRNSYTGDNSTTVFAYTFKIFDDDDITVILRTTATGTETVQTKTTHYSVSGVGSAGGGNITFVTAPTSAQTVVLLRQTAQTQTTDYTPNDPFPAASHEDALDKLTLIQQDQQDELDRAIKLSRTNTMTSTEFTVGASDRANKILAFDGSGELSVTQELGTFTGNWAASTAYYVRDIIKDTSNNNIYICNTAHTSSGSQPISSNTDSAKWDLLVDAASATTSATAAASSATAAAASATAAALSEIAAATSETNAAASEAGVAADAAAAAASASSASTSATNAATSATAAATSASAASTSASNAATSATSASSSASAASTSASNAATSATNASNSASAASTSASNAATSETNAASSATSAASSASSASSAQTAAESARDATLAAYDNFDDRYLGAKSSAPTLDNDGNALVAGALYFDTVAEAMYVYTGSAWVAAYVSGTGFLALTGGTMTGDINYGDNVKAVFGAGSDLQIYHDGSNSYIDETATGDLIIRASAIYLQKYTGETLINAVADGAAKLYYDAAEKLATTSSGIDVTGTVTADGLTVSTDGYRQLLLTYPDAFTSKLQVGFSNFYVQGSVTTDELTIANNSSGQTKFINQSKASLLIDNSNDISFYDSTGVTQGFYWDASTQRLGLGTTVPSGTLDVKGTVYVSGSTSGSTKAVSANSTATEVWHYVGSNGAMFRAYDDSANLMHISAAGSVGIGTTSPATTVHAHSGTAGSGHIRSSSANLNNYIDIGTDTGGHGVINVGTAGGQMQFHTGGGERIRINSDGRMQKGRTSAISGEDISHEYNSNNGAGLLMHSTDTTGNNHNQIIFRRNNSNVGTIVTSGTGTTYNTTSDIRLKQDIEPIADGTDKLMAMNPVSYAWKADPDGPRSMGFIAQEMQEVMPEAVSAGNGEDAMMSMDYGRITPILVSALQDAHRKIDELEQRLADMENN